MSTVLVYGPSGMGKSSAIRTLAPEETFIISSDQKPLPFKGWKKKYQRVLNEKGGTDFASSNLFETKEPDKVLKALEKIEKESKVKTVILDTITHVIVDYFMKRASEKGFERFNDLAKGVYDILSFIQQMTKDVIVIGHADFSNENVMKVRTIGKLLDEKVDIPSLFTTVLVPDINRDEDSAKYYFLTQSDGYTAAKSPAETFPAFRIPNDYQFVLNCIHAYEDDETVPVLPAEAE